MNLLLRQTWALIRKNLLIIVLRKPISTFIRALLIPLLVVFVVAYSKYFFSSPQHWGISAQHTLRSLRDGLAASSNHDIVGFVDNGMTGGDVSSVIDSLSKTVRDAGKTPRLFASVNEMSYVCASNLRGQSPCYGAVNFQSSPTQGTNVSQKGTWNYTISSDYNSNNGYLDMSKDTNSIEVYTSPLQRAVDQEIVARSNSNLPQSVRDIVFTERTEDDRREEQKSNYLALCIYLFGAIFSFTMIGIVYHLTAFVAAERELGISGLIDTMIPGGSALRARLVRQISTYISFAIVYFPSWLVVGIVISTVVFPSSSRGLPVGYHILSGLAFTSFSLLGASFFAKAQLSGSIVTIVALVMAILPQVLNPQKRITVIMLSLLFPTSNYTYFINSIAEWEAANTGKVDMMKLPKDHADWRIELYLNWIFLIFQIILYPILAFLVEHVRFDTASSYFPGQEYTGRRLSTPSSSQAATVTISGFHKTYNPSILSRIFKSRKPVQAVTDMSLNAYRGQILCLLGPNGSGKSTTLNCIAGQHRVTSGNIIIDPTGGLGYAPQGNVLWNDLSVEEHIRIFSNLKCTTPANEEVITDLVKAVDLQKKTSVKAKTLSGGQKRKLQLAMMFAGGSAVCCVDEVSTGLDPISRRRIWEILLAERNRRTIIMTTHFLDEADFLADNVAIMFKGTLKAEGTSATLKNSFGDGYTIKLPDNTDIPIRVSGDFQKEASRHQIVYRVASAGLAAEVVDQLDRANIKNYSVSGPTMEELFLKVTGDKINSDHASVEEEQDDTGSTTNLRSGYHLTDGRPLSAFKQWSILLGKRLRILKRSYLPYFFAIAIAIVGAGVSPLLIKEFKTRMPCPAVNDIVSYSSSRHDLAGSTYNHFLVGPPDKLPDEKLAQLVDIYSTNHTGYYFYGFHNVTELKNRLTFVNTLEEFNEKINKLRYSVTGGIFLSDPPVFASEAYTPYAAVYLQNMMNNIISGVNISTGFSSFAYTKIPDVYDGRALVFIIYFGLIMSCYPAFFALYPTRERLQNVRSMQYSNGVRPLPLWLSHLAFDMIVVVVISVVDIALLAAATPVWYNLGLLFLVLFLFGWVSTLLSYVISMFARSPIAAWAMAAMGQTIMYFAFFGGLIGVQSTTPFNDLESMINNVFFGLGWFSPAVCLMKALATALGQFGILCSGHSNPAHMSLYGGPICLLVIQIIVLSSLLLWWDNGFPVPSVLRRSQAPQQDAEATELQHKDLMAEVARMRSKSTDLRIECVTKRFGRNVAVDDVTFGVQTSEIFALLGPNGAGKSTIISMIRGDIKPSTSNSSINIANYSILTSPVAARANLGVCPQFDAADNLTVNETLRFFARIRGVKDISHNVTTVIAACGLENWATQLAHKLSGGTKRKLSLAVALVGNPAVLVLDEPSSALDANAKRNMWRTLQSVGKGRAVVLTTHSMEEADALADRIGIVSSRMLAVGERESLKRRAGDSYHIHLVARSAPRTSPAELHVMKDWIDNTFAGATISRETQGGQIRVELPAQGWSLVSLIKLLESAKGDLGVEFYSVGKATLDEVFENIVKRYGDGYEK